MDKIFNLFSNMIFSFIMKNIKIVLSQLIFSKFYLYDVHNPLIIN